MNPLQALGLWVKGTPSCVLKVPSDCFQKLEVTFCGGSEFWSIVSSILGSERFHFLSPSFRCRKNLNDFTLTY